MGGEEGGMTEPAPHDSYLGFSTVATAALLAVLGIAGQWWAFLAVLFMVALWKRRSVATLGEESCSRCADERLREFTQDWTAPEKRDVERLISAKKIVHCWEDGPRTLDDLGTTCMREDGHGGEHEWTRDDQLTVRFSGRRRA